MPRAFLLDRAELIRIDVPDATLTIANGINERGQVVGFYVDAAGTPHGFGGTKVGSPPSTSPRARDISDGHQQPRPDRGRIRPHDRAGAARLSAERGRLRHFRRSGRPCHHPARHQRSRPDRRLHDQGAEPRPLRWGARLPARQGRKSPFTPIDFPGAPSPPPAASTTAAGSSAPTRTLLPRRMAAESDADADDDDDDAGRVTAGEPSRNASSRKEEHHVLAKAPTVRRPICTLVAGRRAHGSRGNSGGVGAGYRRTSLPPRTRSMPFFSTTVSSHDRSSRCQRRAHCCHRHQRSPSDRGLLRRCCGLSWFSPAERRLHHHRSSAPVRTAALASQPRPDRGLAGRTQPVFFWQASHHRLRALWRLGRRHQQPWAGRGHLQRGQQHSPLDAPRAYFWTTALYLIDLSV